MLLFGGSRPNSFTDAGLSLTTRPTSSDSIVETSVPTVDASASTASGATICQSVPAFFSVVVSPDAAWTSISSILLASTVKTLSFFFSSDPVRLDSMK